VKGCHPCESRGRNPNSSGKLNSASKPALLALRSLIILGEAGSTAEWVQNDSPINYLFKLTVFELYITVTIVLTKT